MARTIRIDVTEIPAIAILMERLIADFERAERLCGRLLSSGAFLNDAERQAVTSLEAELRAMSTLVSLGRLMVDAAQDDGPGEPRRSWW